MGARSMGGEIGGAGLVIEMNLATSFAPVIGDLVALDTSANNTIKDSVNDALPFGRVEQVGYDYVDGVRTAKRAGVRVFAGYVQCVVLSNNATVAVGSSIQTNVNGANNVEAASGWNGTLIISSVAYGSAYNLLMLC